MTITLLAVSILLATVRNFFSKNISDISFGTKGFFLLQGLIFGCGAVFLSFAGLSFEKLEATLVCYSLIYGMLLIAAQYCYTLALKNGKTGICSMIYSFGFIFPTLSGSIFWNESINVYNIFGIILVAVMIVLCGVGKQNNNSEKTDFLLPIITAMFASGGLGIMQKIQQNSVYCEQKNLFLIIAFLFASIISFVLYCLNKTRTQNFTKRKLASAALIGCAFAASNLCNTILSGKLKAAIFFPVLNIGTIIASIVLGMIIYKEKCTKKDVVVLVVGIIAIIALKI